MKYSRRNNNSLMSDVNNKNKYAATRRTEQACDFSLGIYKIVELLFGFFLAVFILFLFSGPYFSIPFASASLSFWAGKNINRQYSNDKEKYSGGYKRLVAAQ